MIGDNNRDHTLLNIGSQLLADYVSPDTEYSIFKGVPMALREHRVVKDMERAGARIRYRGPRLGLKLLDRSAYDCWKKDAVTFAVY